MQKPELLKPGDKIAIVSPATIVNPDYIDGAAEFLASQGYRVEVMPHAKGPAFGSYAAADALRLVDLHDAIADKDVRAILCARGGYGCNHLLGKLDENMIAADPKWIIGFSDVSALHALWQKCGVMSLHAPMAKHLTTMPANHYCTQIMMDFLSNPNPIELEVLSNPLNHHGRCRGKLVGGNLAVIEGLAGTPYDVLGNVENEDTILFIEDIAEPIYKIERIMIRLKLAGKLQKLKGLVIGEFTEYRSDKNFESMEDMLAEMLEDENMPIAFGFPTGHGDDNLPLLLGAQCTLDVNKESTLLSFREL